MSGMVAVMIDASAGEASFAPKAKRRLRLKAIADIEASNSLAMLRPLIPPASGRGKSQIERPRRQS